MTKSYYDDEAYGPHFLASCLIEEEEKEPSPTGVLDHRGKMIMRLPVPKPARFGFPIFPEDNEGYDNDPDNEYFYGVAS